MQPVSAQDVSQGASRRWSTDDVAPGARLTYWVESVCEAFFELRVDSTAGQGFSGSADFRVLGDVGLIFLRSDDQHVERTRQHVAQARTAQFQLVQFRNSPGLIRQCGREAMIEPGGFTLIDSREVFTIDNQAGQDALSITLPVDWLNGWLREPENAIARVWRPGEGWGGVLASLLARLEPQIGGGLDLPGSVGGEQIGALLALTLGEAGAPPVLTRSDAELLPRLKDLIRSGCHDPALTPQQVAAEAGVSLRSLHYELARASTSFGAELLACRCSGAWRMLADARFVRVTVADVARRWGFADRSHFARCFKQRYGASPAEFRASLHA